jgi:phosphonate transport system substrate-binding protein
MKTRFMRAVLISIGFLVSYASAEGAGKTLVIGRISNNPSKNYQELKPLLDYVVGHMADVGITQGSVILVKDQKEMIQMLNDGKIDWATKGVFQAILSNEQAGAEIFLRSWREGVATYYSVIFARKDSGVKSLGDLKGKKIAFQDRNSTTAYFVPAALLKNAGYQLLELPSPRENPPADKIGYAFAGDELSISTWVHRGLTQAGAYHNQNWASPETNPDAMKKDLKIIYQSKPLPRIIEVVRKDLDPKIKNRLKQILLKAHEDPAAKEALSKYGPRTAKFDEFLGEAKEGLEEAKKLMQYMDMGGP